MTVIRSTRSRWIARVHRHCCKISSACMWHMPLWYAARVMSLFSRIALLTDDSDTRQLWTNNRRHSATEQQQRRNLLQDLRRRRAPLVPVRCVYRSIPHSDTNTYWPSGSCMRSAPLGSTGLSGCVSACGICVEPSGHRFLDQGQVSRAYLLHHISATLATILGLSV